MVDFEQYAPQRIFLLAGTGDTYDALLASLEARTPIVHGMSLPRLTMDHAKTIARFAVEGDGTRRYLVVYFSIFSPDAAQVLLKSLEEPDEQVTIVFVTPHPYVVPLTIRSRIMMLLGDAFSKPSAPWTQAKALAYIKEELSSESDEDAASRRAKAIMFLDTLEQQTRDNRTKSEIVYQAKHMLFVANMPTKYVAEYVAVAVL